MRVLQVIGTFDIGGAETMLVNLLESGMEFDACAVIPDTGAYESRMNGLGCKTYHLTRRSKSMLKHHAELFKIIHDGKYDVVHFHTQNSFLTYLHVLTAKAAGAKVIAVHSHNTSDWRSKDKKKLNMQWQKPLYKTCDIRLACGYAAAEWLYGTTEGVEILPLPINTSKFLSTNQKRMELRTKFRIDSKDIVLLHVGSFRDAKNQKYLIESIAPAIAKHKHLKLFLIGNGPLQEDAKCLVHNLGITANVCFLGNLQDPSPYYIIADGFFLPSKYEGFPTVLLEAQAAGLQCAASDTIDKDVDIANAIDFLPITEDKKVLWGIEAEIAMANPENVRKKMNQKIAERYDVSIVKERLEALYQNALNAKK